MMCVGFRGVREKRSCFYAVDRSRAEKGTLRTMSLEASGHTRDLMAQLIVYTRLEERLRACRSIFDDCVDIVADGSHPQPQLDQLTELIDVKLVEALAEAKKIVLEYERQLGLPSNRD